jgi:nucleoid-associated protein YgaU
MKQVVFLWAILTLCAAPTVRGQDAATEERLNQLSGKIDDLTSRQEAQRQEIERLRRENASLQEQLNKPAPSYATLEYAKSLAEAIQKVDRNRLEDNEKTRAKLQDLINKIAALAAAPPVVVERPIIRRPPPPVDEAPSEKQPPEESGSWHTIKSGETLSAIVQFCRDNNMKVTQEKILKANPRLKPDLLIPGTKIFIPVEKPAQP